MDRRKDFDHRLFRPEGSAANRSGPDGRRSFVKTEKQWENEGLEWAFPPQADCQGDAAHRLGHRPHLQRCNRFRHRNANKWKRTCLKLDPGLRRDDGKESCHQKKRQPHFARFAHLANTPTLLRMQGREQSGIPQPQVIRDVLNLMTPPASAERAHSMTMPFPALPNPSGLPIHLILRAAQRKTFQSEDRAVPLFVTGLRVGGNRQQHVLQTIRSHMLR